ncbi:TetR/AcrR family transcriptional regulator [Streptomyces sp. DSM 44917]|uniref:TetR/AcrR family transcriptional regulator n=2 Tax=Streptomyces TaxID=1883 RepID=A0ABU2LFD1_9ACTN|nr:TetR/AcrR family transcriptional regulator [Streptomyces sp. DSM 44917]MDT0309967.1 TetR/AcrR family transcriptional regulator [Streptomyces sp. DSM 44917]
MSDKRRRRLPRDVREQEIIDAALQVFSKRGYHAAVVDEIAELAGISKPMVYLYLGSKEGLFVSCIRREADRMAATFRDAAQAAGDSPEQRLYAGLTAFFAFVSERRDSWRVLHRQAPEQGEAIAAELAAARRAVMEEVGGLVMHGITEAGSATHLDEQDADYVAHALVGAADALTDWMERHPGESPDRMTQRLMNMMWVGMRNVLGGEIWLPPAGTVGVGKKAPAKAGRARAAVPKTAP